MSALTQAELQAHLTEQLGFLEASASSFDSGFEGEAKRLALTMRVLLHQTRQSHSLLNQLGMTNQQFVNTADDITPGNLVADTPLVGIMGGNERYVAFRDSAPPVSKPLLPFEDWWNAVVVSDGSAKFSRRELVLTSANKDGGGHVDPVLDVQYRALKEHAVGWSYEKDGMSAILGGVETASLRQIAHEVLKTLKPGYMNKLF